MQGTPSQLAQTQAPRSPLPQGQRTAGRKPAAESSLGLASKGETSLRKLPFSRSQVEGMESSEGSEPPDSESDNSGWEKPCGKSGSWTCHARHHKGSEDICMGKHSMKLRR